MISFKKKKQCKNVEILIIRYIFFELLEYQVHDGRQMYKLKEDHIYYDQLQGQIYILNKSACDFVVWTTRDIAIVRVLQDGLWGQNIEKLTNFYFAHLISVIQK